MSKYVAPKFKFPSFNCPICGAFAHQIWTELTIISDDPNEFFYWDKTSDLLGEVLEEPRPIQLSGIDYTQRKYRPANILYVSRCSCCNKYALWADDKLIIPSVSTVPQPNEHMPKDIADIYNEASNVFNSSPRSSAALLRLALQKLLIHLGERGENLNYDICNLVKKGVPEYIQQAADVIRYTGNEAVHPETINFEDNSDTVITLFNIINTIIDYMISRKEEINVLFDSLPKTIKESILRRNKDEVSIKK